jgi:uncharacterized membrane protein HdeD (DUF308 family)
MVEQLIRNWGWLALRGFLAIVFGALTLFYPGITLVTLVFLFGAYAMVDGVFMIVSAIANRKTQPRWGTLVFGGILGVAAGVLTYLWPGITALALLAIIAAWAIVMGVVEIAVAIRLRKEITGEWVMVLAGLLAVAFGVLLVIYPATGALAVALWIGAYAVVSGVLLVVLAFRLRNWGRSHGLLQAAA